MAVPDYQSLMLPLLRYCRDGVDHSLAEVVNALAKELVLSESDVSETLPNSGQSKLVNRVGWAKSYLKQAGLLEIPKRGLFRITDRGQQTLTAGVASLDVKYLEQFPEFKSFRTRSRQRETTDILAKELVLEATPDELMAGGYKQLREALAIELLERIKSVSPSRFEELVVELLLKMGYGGTQEDAGRVVGKSGDGGIDGIINEDRLGLDVIYIQAKRWEADVGRPEIQKFVGALAGNKANKGVFITSSGFSKGATEYAAQVNHRVVLIDGPMLAELMMDHDLGVSTKDVYTVKRLDTDYFEED
jgi:restriction system protein